MENPLNNIEHIAPIIMNDLKSINFQNQRVKQAHQVPNSTLYSSSVRNSAPNSNSNNFW